MISGLSEEGRLVRVMNLAEEVKSDEEEGISFDLGGCFGVVGRMGEENAKRIRALVFILFLRVY